jgi:hypothetical protein
MDGLWSSDHPDASTRVIHRHAPGHFRRRDMTGFHNIVKTVTFRQGIVARIALLFNAGAIVLSSIGGFLSPVVPVYALKILLGLFLILDADGAWLRENAAQIPRNGNMIVVTHMPNMSRAFPQVAGVADGESLIFRPDGNGGATLVGRIKIEEWPGLR